MNIDDASKGIGTGIGIAAMGIGLGIAFDAMSRVLPGKSKKKLYQTFSYKMPRFEKIKPIKTFKWK